MSAMEATMTTKKIMTKREVADFLRVSERQVDRLRQMGRLTCFNLGSAKSLRFNSEDVEALMSAQR